MNRFNRIESQMREAFRPLHLEVENESHKHSVPPNSETHFKLLVVSEAFEGLSRVDRQRKIYSLLDREFQSGLHALALRALTPVEYAKAHPEFQSPDCHSAKGKSGS